MARKIIGGEELDPNAPKCPFLGMHPIGADQLGNISSVAFSCLGERCRLYHSEMFDCGERFDAKAKETEDGPKTE